MPFTKWLFNSFNVRSCSILLSHPHGYRPGGKIIIFPFRVRFVPTFSRTYSTVTLDASPRGEASRYAENSHKASLPLPESGYTSPSGTWDSIVLIPPCCTLLRLQLQNPVSHGVRKDDTVSIDSPVVSPRTYDEPVITRKKSWRNYRKSCSFPVYYNGESVRLLSCSLLG